MPARTEENYGLLHDQDDIGNKENMRDHHGSELDPEPGNSFLHRFKFYRPRAPTKTRDLVMLSLIMSGTVNLILATLLTRTFFYPRSHTETEIHTVPSEISLYAGLSPNPSARFPYSTGYGLEVTNHSLLDEKWEAIDINPGVVAISDEWAAEHNLAATQRFPWDNTKGVYLLTAFHTLHCLKNIHRLLYDAHHGRPLSRDIGHAMHCVDHMRKDAMCGADDFLLPSPKSRYGTPGPRGQSRVCKDWDALVTWAEGHNACYQHISDDEENFAEEHDEIERYKNCPPTSPYLEKMQEHFRPADGGI